MRLKLWSNRALLVCLLGCGGTETPPEETSRTPRRDAGASTDDDDSSDEADSEDEEDDDGTTSSPDAGRRNTVTRIPDGAPDGCGTSEFNTTPVIPDMLIVLDRSGSMRTGGVDRWGPSVAAVKTLTTTFTDQIGFGLMTFPFANELCGPGQIQVPVAMKTAAQIAQILDRSAPQGGTPTGDTLHVALQSYRDMGTDAEGGQRPRYVLLMTDGQPTCPAAQGTSGSVDSAGNLAADKKLTIEALDQLAAEGIKTFVVGYDAELDPTLAAALNEFAKHGKTERYFPVQDERSLIAAFEDISSTVISCTFAFEKAVSDPRYLRVEFDGKLLRLDDPNGFTFEGQSVTLQGTTCEALQGRASHNVEINLECTPVI